MTHIVRVLGQVEPTNNVSIVLVAGDPRVSPGLALGVGSIAHDPSGNVYRKTDAAATDWTKLEGAIDVTGAPDGTTGVGVAEKGALAIDRTTPDLYINVGDATTPSWKKITRAS